MLFSFHLSDVEPSAESKESLSTVERKDQPSAVPRQAIAKDEDVENLAIRPPAMSKRPGRNIVIKANHFPFIARQQTIYQYSVEFSVRDKSDLY